MAFRITTNMASITAQRFLDHSQRNIDKSFAQLGSGSRITKAADDAAGLSISETFKGQIRGYKAAQRNTMDGLSMTQVAEGGLSEISNILVRLRELGVQAASDTIGDRERGFVNEEVQHLLQESERIAHTTRFGSVEMLNGTAPQFDFQVDIFNDDFKDRIQFDGGANNVTTAELGIEAFDYSTKDGAKEAMGTIEQAQVKVNTARARLGAIQNRLLSTHDNLGTYVENLSAATSRIRDTDIAESAAELTRNNVLLNASVGVLSQANAHGNQALRLLS